MVEEKNDDGETESNNKWWVKEKKNYILKAVKGQA